MSAAAAAIEQASSATVYVKNLAENIKIPALTEALEEIFSTFGNVVEIVAKSNLRAKGQAFVVFDDPASAEAAIEGIQGFEVFEKPMVLAFAKTRSDATVKAEGNEVEFEAHKRRRLAEKERKQAAEKQAEAQREKLKRPADPLVVDTTKPVKAARGAGLKSTNAGAAVVPDEYLPPNKILFVQNLPQEYDVDGLSAIFGRFEGFREVRLVPGRAGLAFVEYEVEQGAISAKESTAGMVLGAEQATIKVTYQRQ